MGMTFCGFLQTDIFKGTVEFSCNVHCTTQTFLESLLLLLLKEYGKNKTKYVTEFGILNTRTRNLKIEFSLTFIFIHTKPFVVAIERVEAVQPVIHDQLSEIGVFGMVM